jgi:hypothetical protein
MKKIAYLIIGLMLLSLCSCANYVVPPVYTVSPTPYIAMPYPACTYTYRPYFPGCDGFGGGSYYGGCGGCYGGW